MQQGKDYFAFISYQRKDEKWADWLRKKLEHYRLPSNLRKKDASLPKEIRPIFRDALELAGGVLADEIQAALQQSKFLIVICSPNSAQSPWVNKEIQTFIDLGREDRIIPFIIDGTPFSDNEETECFPPALRSLKDERELLGININEMGRDAAAVKVVARMFGLKFDALWQRYEREKRHRRNLLLVAVTAFVLAVVGVAAWIWHQNRELSMKNALINEQNLALDAKTDSLRYANDSIQAQQNALQIAYNDLARSQHDLAVSNENLVVANYRIAEERDNVRKANYSIQINMSRLLAEKASALAENGDNYTARILSLEALETGQYVPELECVLRKSSQFDNAVLRGHSDEVRKAACSPDGNMIASVSNDHTVRVWDAQTGSCTHVLNGHDDMVVCVTFSPDGKEVISGSEDKTIRVWDVATGQCLHVLSGHTSGVDGVFFCTDGRTLISYSSDKGTVVFWDYPNKQLRRKVTCKSVKAVSPDGKLYAKHDYSKDINDWHIISIETGEELCCLKGLQESSSIAFSPNGKLVATGCYGEHDNSIRIWDLASGECLFKTNNIDESTIYSLSFTPDNNTLLAACGGHIFGNKNDIRIWKKNVPYEDWIFEDELAGHLSHVYDAFFTPDMSRIVSASADQTVRIWDQGKGDILRTITTDFAHSAMISPDGKRIATTYEDDGTMYIWGKQDSIPIEGSPFTMPAFSPDGTKFVSADKEGTVGLWAATTGKCVMKMSGHEDVVNSVAYSPNGQLVASASEDASIRLWDTTTGECKGILNDQNAVPSVCFSPDGKQLISGSSDANIRIWDVKSKDCMRIIHGHTGPINSVDYSADGRFIVSSACDSTIRLWDVKTGKFIRLIGQHDNEIRLVKFSSDGKKVISIGGEDDLIKIWDVESGKCLHSLESTVVPGLDGRGYQISCAMFSPDGKEIMGMFQEGPANIYIWRYPPFDDLVNQTRKRFKNRQLTPEERRKYYLE